MRAWRKQNIFIKTNTLYQFCYSLLYVFTSVLHVCVSTAENCTTKNTLYTFVFVVRRIYVKFLTCSLSIDKRFFFINDLVDHVDGVQKSYILIPNGSKTGLLKLKGKYMYIVHVHLVSCIQVLTSLRMLKLFLRWPRNLGTLFPCLFCEKKILQCGSWHTY